MMKKLVLLSVFIFLACSESKEKTFVAEVACGQCQFELSGQAGCDLAIKFEGKAYFVDGAHIDDFGDAHDKNSGFCEVVRKAEVRGKLENNRFVASSIVLKPLK